MALGECAQNCLSRPLSATLLPQGPCLLLAVICLLGCSSVEGDRALFLSPPPSNISFFDDNPCDCSSTPHLLRLGLSVGALWSFCLQAWLVPLTVGALLRLLGGDTAEKASAWLARASGYLQHTESLQAAGIKLTLALTSAVTVWAAAMAVFVVEYGEDTLVGWVGSLLVWRPRYWLQVRVLQQRALLMHAKRAVCCVLFLFSHLNSVPW